MSERVWPWGGRGVGREGLLRTGPLGSSLSLARGLRLSPESLALWSPRLGPGAGSADSAKRAGSARSLVSWLRQRPWGARWPRGRPAAFVRSGRLPSATGRRGECDEPAHGQQSCCPRSGGPQRGSRGDSGVGQRSDLMGAEHGVRARPRLARGPAWPERRVSGLPPVTGPSGVQGQRALLREAKIPDFSMETL